MRLIDWLVAELREGGFENLTGAMPAFPGKLDCGESVASALARWMGISRQAIHKQVRELERLGWLEMRPHPEKGNQKVIVFTVEDERMMSVARDRFATLDKKVDAELGIDSVLLSECLGNFAF